MDKELEKSLRNVFCAPPEGVHVCFSTLSFLNGIYLLFVEGIPLSTRYTNKGWAENDAGIIRRHCDIKVRSSKGVRKES